VYTIVCLTYLTICQVDTYIIYLYIIIKTYLRERN